MARRKVRPQPTVAETSAEPVSLAARVDPRLSLMAPLSVQVDPDPEALFHWARANHPAAVLSEDAALARRTHLARQRRFSDARREARKRGLPAPNPDDFFERD